MEPISAREILFWTSIVVYVFNVSAFSWALKKFFVNKGGLPKKMQKLGFAAGFIAVMQVASMTGSSKEVVWSQVTGLCLTILSGCLFWITIHHNRQNPLPVAFSNLQSDFIRTTGPYRFIRHPFYLSYILTWVAAPFIAESTWLALTSLIMILVYIRLIRDEEAHLLSGTHGAIYHGYMQKTGCLIPKLL